MYLGHNNGPYMMYLKFFFLNAEKYSRLQILQDGGVNIRYVIFWTIIYR